MSRKNWKALQIEYIRVNARTGISVKDWCIKKGLNFSTAKRYIKKPETVLRRPENSEINCEISNKSANNKKSIKSKDCNKKDETKCETNSESSCETAKRLAISLRNAKSAKKHGGYSRYFKDKSAFDVVVDFSLKDEIDLMRQRAVSAIESIERFTEQMEKVENTEDKEIYSKLITAANNALDRAVARIESLNYTDNSIANILSQIELRKVQAKKIIAETDKMKQEINMKSSARDKVIFVQEYE